MEHITSIYKGGVLVFGAAASYFLGEWSVMLEVLLIFVVVDYLSGLFAASHEGILSSQVGFKGIGKKVFIFLMIAIAHAIDRTLGEGYLIRDATIFFYLANELLSIIENAGRVNFPIPEPIKQAVSVLKGKTNGRND